MIERPLKIYEDELDGGGEYKRFIVNKKGKKIYIKSKLSKKKLQKHLKVNLKRKKKKIATRVYTRKQPSIDRARDTSSNSSSSGKAPLGKDYIYLTTKEKDDNLLKELKKNRETRLLELGMTPTVDNETKLNLLKSNADMKAEIKTMRNVMDENITQGTKAVLELSDRLTSSASSKAEPKNQVKIRGVSTGRKSKPEEGYTEAMWKQLSSNEKTKIKRDNLKKQVADSKKQNKDFEEEQKQYQVEQARKRELDPSLKELISRHTTGFNLKPPNIGLPNIEDYEDYEPPVGDKKQRVLSKMKDIAREKVRVSNKDKFETKKATFEAMKKVREDRVKDIPRYDRLFIEPTHIPTNRMREEYNTIWSEGSEEQKRIMSRNAFNELNPIIGDKEQLRNFLKEDKNKARGNEGDKSRERRLNKNLQPFYNAYNEDLQRYNEDQARFEEQSKKIHKVLEDNEDLDGNGERQTDGDDSLYETQIQDILKKHECIECPVIANDEIHTIKMNPTKQPTFFIMNLSDRDSKEGGTVVLQSDVPTTDLSKNGKFQKRSDEWAGKPAGGYEPIRAEQRRCQVDPVPRTHPIKSPIIWSLSLTSSRTAGRFPQITTSPVRLKYSLPREQAQTSTLGLLRLAPPCLKVRFCLIDYP